MIQLSPYFLARELSGEIERFADNTEEAVCFTTLDGRLEWCNRAFSMLFGYTFEEAAGRRPVHFLAGEETSQEELVNINYELMCAEDSFRHMLFYAKTGTRLWVSLRVNPAYDDNHNLSHMVWVMRDGAETADLDEGNAQLQDFIEKLSQQKAADS